MTELETAQQRIAESTTRREGMTGLKPMCEASNRYHRNYPNAALKDEANRMPCPVCGKVVTLKKYGLDFEPDTLPQHRVPTAQQGDSNDR